MTQHRRSFSRYGWALAVPTVGALLLTTACSGESSESVDGANGFSLTYATSNNLESPYERLARVYMEENPDVSIELAPQPNDRYGETLRTQLQAGNAPDVVQTAPGTGQAQGIVPLAEAGFLEPLDDAAAELIPAGNESLFYTEDELYGQPVDLTVSGFVYNTSAADAAGLDEFPDATAELLDLCETLANDGTSAIALAGAAPPNTGMTAMSVSATRVYAETPDWNQQRADGAVTFADSEGWQETLETIVELNETGCFQDGAEGGGFDAITNGLAQGTSLGAFIPSGAASELQSAAPDQNFAIEAFPPPEGGDPYILASSNYSLSINAASERKEAAQEFLDWVAEPEQAQLFADISGVLPVTGVADVDLSDTRYAPVGELIQSESYTALPNSTWPNQSVYDELSTGVQGLLTGQSTVDQVLTAMDDAWEN
ncbi:ABC transporter substrate-binding protein [Salinactinospora qingdaonensis]|uniref:Extracellular solute-binding protein n=1 Tax=Salinactinospora qingdaonensis TaxID=702744 RepID=A0ABP7G6I3_9ACTN